MLTYAIVRTWLMPIALCAALTMSVGLVYAAPPPTQIGGAFLPITSHDLKSSQGLTYRIIVSAPVGKAPRTGYPVIYVLDGNAWAPLASEIIRFNGEFGVRSRVEPAVVVGIGYPIDTPFDMSRRFHDLTTPSNMSSPYGNMVQGTPGGYLSMLNFIESVVKPDIERRFSIDKRRQTLIGHSLGGLFTLRTLLTRPASFQTFVALSPSIWWDYASVLKDVKTFTPDPSIVKNTRVFIAVGELEGQISAEEREGARKAAEADPTMLGDRSIDQFMKELDEFGRTARMVENARDVAGVLSAKGFGAEFHLFPDEDHFSVVPAEMGRAVPFALKR